MSTLLKIIHRLDLSSQAPAQEAEQGEDPTPTSALTSNLSTRQPTVLKDYHILINLVDFCR